MVYKVELIHQRKSIKRIRITYYHFNTGIEIVDLVQQCEYLGILRDEHLKLNICNAKFAKSDGRRLFRMYIIFLVLMCIAIYLILA